MVDMAQTGRGSVTAHRDNDKKSFVIPDALVALTSTEPREPSIYEMGSEARMKLWRSRSRPPASW